MKADFDRAAPNYDTTFTHSTIGKLQRDVVYRQLSEIVQGNPKKILEINCGTGEDAIWFAKQNHQVTATDISGEMIAVAQAKTPNPNPHFEVADINHIAEMYADCKFDLIFSNFGGLNCLSPGELENFIHQSASMLNPCGQLFLVIMPKNTLWEWIYFSVKGHFRSVFRRRKKSVQANVEGKKVETFYYNPKQIVHLSNGLFKTRKIKPVGFFIPPSYLEPFIKPRPRLTRFLRTLEQKISNFSQLAQFADHYVILLQKT